jgi:hypothetical protein
MFGMGTLVRWRGAPRDWEQDAGSSTHCIRIILQTAFVKPTSILDIGKACQI